jgi:hypothetical protein
MGDGDRRLIALTHLSAGREARVEYRPMAASKKTAKGKGAAGAQTAMTVSTAAFKHGASAYGAHYMKKGFGFSEQEDLEWALGWPHVRRLVDSHPADADPLSFLVGTAFPVYDIDFPREQAARRVRFHLFCPSTPDEDKKWATLARPYLETAGPITEEEARSVITQHLKPVPDLWWWAFLPQIILLCEAFVGTQPVAEALVETVEACPPDVLKSESSERSDCVSLLGFLLLRLPEPVHAALERRLRKVLDAVVATLPDGLAEAGDDDFHRPYRSLDRVLNGKPAALRSGEYLDQADLLFAGDDPAFIVESLGELPGPGDLPPFARLAFLGGDGVLDVETTWWKKYNEPRTDTHRIFVQHYARIRSEKMLAIFLAMSQTSKARKEAAAWFAAHADYARPYLERAAAGKGDAAAWAKVLL